MTGAQETKDTRFGRRSRASIPSKFRNLLSLDDFEAAAKRRLPRPLFGYVNGGVEDGFAMRGAAGAYEEYALVPRFLAGVHDASISTTLFGESFSAPFGIAPMGICAMNAYRSDLCLARAAGKAEIPMIISGSSLIPLEQIMDANPRAWFQAYLPADRQKVTDLLDRASAAGVENLVVTVDSTVGSNRENNVRSGFSSPLRPSLRLAWDGLVRPRWLVSTFLRTLINHGMPHFENLYSYRSVPIIARSVEREFSGRAQFNWEDFAHVRQHWKGRLIIKGLLHPGDAAKALAAGVDGLVVSNHGGRQLDAAVAPLHVLPLIREAVKDLPIIIDSGIRRGTHVAKALALGADFVLVGRPFNFAAAIAEDEGVAYAISLLKSETLRTLAQIGERNLDELDHRHIIPRGLVTDRGLLKDVDNG